MKCNKDFIKGNSYPQQKFNQLSCKQLLYHRWPPYEIYKKYGQGSYLEIFFVQKYLIDIGFAIDVQLHIKRLFYLVYK